jgi:hypothetical protein
MGVGIAKPLSNMGVLFTDRRDFYIKPQTVAHLWPTVTPFTTIMMSRGTEKVQDPDYKLFEYEGKWVRQEFTAGTIAAAQNWGGSDANATALPGDTSASLATLPVATSPPPIGITATVAPAWRNLQLEIRSAAGVYKGVGLVHAINTSTNSITVKSLGNPRADNNAALALATGDVFYIIGNAFGEGTYAAKAWHDDLEVVYNSAQIFKTAVNITGTLKAAALRGYSSELARLRVEKAKEHKIQKERAFLKGVRSHGTGMQHMRSGSFASDSFANHQVDEDGNLIRTTMGIVPAIFKYGSADPTSDEQNIFQVTMANYNYAQFVDDSEKMFNFLPAPGYKRGLCGPGAYSYWSKMANDSGFAKKSGWKVQLGAEERDKLGFKVRRLETPHGDLLLTPAPIFRGPERNTMLVIDEDYVGHTLYRPSAFQTNIKTDDGYDGVKDQYFSDEGVRIGLIKTHSIWEFV